MTQYEATVSADFSGYTNSVQQSIALTQQFAAANEGLTGFIGRNGTKAIMSFTNAMDLQQKMMKTNVSEAARYQQVLGGVSAKAKAAGKELGEMQKVTKSIARRQTGDIESASALVESVIEAGEQSNKNLEKRAKLVTQITAATGSSGTAVMGNLKQMLQTYGSDTGVQSIENLSDSLTTVTAKFGASADAVSGFSTQIAPFAKQIGISETSVLGFSTAFAKMGESGSRSSRVFSTVLSDIDRAVRDGTPVLGKYAAAMGMTTKQVETLVKNDPTEMVIRFTEALAEGGNESIRTMESLGLGSVLEQRAISNLSSYGKLRETVETAQKGYASGITAESAEEQLSGLNEQTAKLQESLTQTVANSGAPYINMLEGITEGSAKAADGLASLTGSEGFQTLLTIGMIGGVALKGVGGAAMGMYNAAGAAGAVGGISKFIPESQRERARSMWATFGANRGKIAGAGLGAMALGQMTESPGLGMLGSGAFIAASALGPGSMSLAKRGWGFMTDDANAIARATSWSDLKTSMDPTNQAKLAAGREMSGLAGWRRGGQFGYSGRERYIFEELKKQGNVDAEDLKTLRRDVFGTYGKRGKLALEPQINKLYEDIAKGVTIDPGQISKLRGEAAKAAGAQMGGQRALGAGRQVAATTGNMLAGMGGLLLNPYVAAGVGATAVVAGGAYLGYKEYQEGQRTRENLTSGSGLVDAQKFAAAMGDTVPVFNSLSSSAKSVEEGFNNVARAIEASIGKGESPELTAGEWGGLEAKKPSFEFTDIQHRGLPWNRQNRTDTEAVAELMSKYGMDTSAKGRTQMYAELKDLGFSREEANELIGNYSTAVASPESALDTAIQAYVSEGGRGNARETLSKNIANWQALNAGKPDEVVQQDLIDQIMASDMPEHQKRSLLNDLAQEGGPLEGKIDTEKLNAVSVSQVASASGYGTTTVTTPAALEGAVKEATIGGRAWERGTAQAAVEGLYGTGIAAEGEEPHVDTMIEGWLRKGAEAQQIVDKGITATGEKATEAQIEQAKKDLEQEGTAAAVDFASGFIKEMSETEPGKEIEISGLGRHAAAAAEGEFGTTGAVTALKQEQYRYTAESTEGKVYAQAVAVAEREQEREYKGMSDVGSIRARREAAVQGMATATEGYETGVNQEQALADFAQQQQIYEDSIDAEEAWMRQYLTAYKAHTRQMRYAQEDYERSRSHMQEDYATQRRQATEQYHTQMRYMEEDYNRQMLYMQADYQKQLDRSERDYQKQRVRAAEDHAVQLGRAAEQAAKNMYDPFKRIALEQSWSGEGLIDNLEEQQRMFNEQIANLDKLRAAGVSQQSIDLLGLNDPAKAQQLRRLLGDIEGSTEGDAMIDRLNQLAKDRAKSGGVLFGPENDMGARAAEEDYNKSLNRMAEDRQQWLADSEADYNEAAKRAEDAFILSQERAAEGFATTMRNMRTAHNTALTRMEEAHATSTERAAEAFEATFETMGGNFETLATATTAALNGETPEWTTIVVNSADDMSTAFAEGAGKVPEKFVDELTGIIDEKWGKDSDVGKALGTMLAAIAAGVGGPEPGPEPGAPGSIPGQGVTAPVPGVDYSGSQGGDKSATGNKGRFSARYGVKGSWAAGYHTGADIAVPSGTPLYATTSGTVIQSGSNREGAYGKSVTVQVAGKDVQVFYAHMSAPSIEVGRHVSSGTYIGRSGNTGRSFGPHVHVEARKKPYGYYDNIAPYKYMWQGGIATRPTKAMIGENVTPEAVIPLDKRGADFVASLMRQLLGSLGGVGPLGHQTRMSTVNTVINEDNSVNVNGPVTVVSQDPNKVMRELERAARDRAIIQPMTRSMS